MKNLIDLSNRKILITGASSGIGQATAILAGSLGATVVLCGRDKDRLSQTLSQMENKEKHTVVPFDVCEFDNYKQLFDAAVSDGIHLSGMVHCAGIASVIPLRIMKQEQIVSVMNTNFNAYMQLISFYAKKKYSSGGSIVGISAINAHYPQKCMSVYAASKAAVEAATRTLSLELMNQKIRINCVVPGAIDTPMAKGFGENAGDDKLDMINQTQLLGLGNPYDVANAIVYLLSDASKFTTGRELYVDGGKLGQI